MRRGDETRVTIRPAIPTEDLEVRRILDAAMLEFEGLTARLEAGDVLVAAESVDGSRRTGDSSEGTDATKSTGLGADRERLLGALVLEPRASGAVVDAVAVRRQRRARGIGTRLVTRALEREGRLRARFDDRVRPFYDSLGFEVRAVDDGRYEGVLEG